VPSRWNESSCSGIWSVVSRYRLCIRRFNEGDGGRAAHVPPSTRILPTGQCYEAPPPHFYCRRCRERSNECDIRKLRSLIRGGAGLRGRSEQDAYYCWTLGEAGRAARGAGATGFDRRFIEQTKFGMLLDIKQWNLHQSRCLSQRFSMLVLLIPTRDAISLRGGNTCREEGSCRT
jgi:hypothetical protein